MKNKIKLLSEKTINQIAAGEVIECPASVIKELLENSFDALSSMITVEIMAGGFHLIRVSDNGEGMDQEDALLSLERHATSKIFEAEDLFKITTMGFRGEALASIASISKLTLSTNALNDVDKAIEIKSEGGRLLSCKKTSRIKGTTVEVRHLFYTTPARKKFQKTPPQSIAEIHRILTVAALARPDVGIKFVSNDEVVFNLKKGELDQRIKDLFSIEFFLQMRPFEFKKEDLSILGYVSCPGYDRPSRASQFLFVNQRPVFSSLISTSITEGYGTMLGIRRYPFFVLNLALDPSSVDVNVHPQKKEIRFHDPIPLKEKIKNLLSDSLNAQIMKERSSVCVPQFFTKELKTENVLELEPLFEKENHQCLLEPLIAPKISDIKWVGIFKRWALIDGDSISGILELEKNSKQKLVTFDVFKAEQRLIFDAFMVNKLEKIHYQQLLFPVKLTFSFHEVELLEKNLPLIESVGIKMYRFGKEGFIIESLESSIDEEKAKELLLSCLEILHHDLVSPKTVHEKLALKVCSFLKEKDDFLDLDQIKITLTKLLKSPQPYYSPEGKKIFDVISLNGV